MWNRGGDGEKTQRIFHAMGSKNFEYEKLKRRVIKRRFVYNWVGLFCFQGAAYKGLLCRDTAESIELLTLGMVYAPWNEELMKDEGCQEINVIEVQIFIQGTGRKMWRRSGEYSEWQHSQMFSSRVDKGSASRRECIEEFEISYAWPVRNLKNCSLSESIMKIEFWRGLGRSRE